jgi:Fe-S-cluster containining protein
MHAAVDRGIASAVRREEKRRRARLACRRGCASCCRVNTDIPVFPVELAGISRFCTEELAGDARGEVRRQCAAHARGGPCPFLVAGACAVYPVRPTACRLLGVFGAPCAEDEDAWHARRDAVLVPPPALLERAYRIMLPFHGVTEPADQDLWLARGLVRTLAANLPALDWRSLAGMMRAFEERGPRT